jgi:hypothetical protein
LITKVLLSAAIAVGAAVGTATPTSADPSLFQILSCGCEEAVTFSGSAAGTDATDLGIQNGLAYMRGGPQTNG